MPLVRNRGNALVVGVARSFVIGVRAEFADRDLSARANSSTKHAICSLGSRGPLKLDLGHVGRFQMMKCTMRKLNFMQDSILLKGPESNYRPLVVYGGGSESI